MKKIHNHSIIGSQNYGKTDTLFESWDELKIFQGFKHPVKVIALLCEPSKPIGYVSANIENTFLAVYEFEKHSFSYIQEKIRTYERYEIDEAFQKALDELGLSLNGIVKQLYQKFINNLNSHIK